MIVGEQQRRKEQHEGDGEDAALWGYMPVRKPMWLARKHRRRRRLRKSLGAEEEPCQI